MVDSIRQRRVLCLIAKVNEKTGFTPKQLSDFIKQFPNIPVIAIVAKNKIDLAFNCGKAGVDDLLPVSELEKLQAKLFRVLSLRQMQSVQELDFDITNCSRRVIRVIEFIETHFTKIQFIKEVAFIFGVNIATLSREFSKETGVHIKKLLNFNKVRYAAYLMKYSELSLNEICTWAGFSNRFVFLRNFRRFMDLTPGEYRKMNCSIDFKVIFQQKVKK